MAVTVHVEELEAVEEVEVDEDEVEDDIEGDVV